MTHYEFLRTEKDKEMPIEKVRKMLPLDWEAMKKLGYDEDDLDMLEGEITDAITAHLCPGDFLPGEHHEDRDCPNDCTACWGGYVELVKGAAK